VRVSRRLLENMARRIMLSYPIGDIEIQQHGQNGQNKFTLFLDESVALARRPSREVYVYLEGLSNGLARGGNDE